MTFLMGINCTPCIFLARCIIVHLTYISILYFFIRHILQVLQRHRLNNGYQKDIKRVCKPHSTVENIKTYIYKSTQIANIIQSVEQEHIYIHSFYQHWRQNTQRQQQTDSIKQLFMNKSVCLRLESELLCWKLNIQMLSVLSHECLPFEMSWTASPNIW